MALKNDKHDSKKLLCDSCDSEDNVESRCDECGMYLCQFCTEFHKRSRLFKHHKLLTVEELKSNPGQYTITEKIRCSKHMEEIIQLFCKTCQTTTCRNCTIADHREHEYAFVEEVATEEKQNLQQILNEVKQRKGKVVQGIDDLKEFNKTLETKKNSTITEINHHFDELAKSVAESLECRKNEMVEKATSLTNSKQMKICAQVEVLEVALASCENSIQFTERAFENGNNAQILSIEKCIMQSLEQLKTVKDQTDPCVTESMVFVVPSSLQEINQKHLNDYDVKAAEASPENCTATFTEDDETIETFNPGEQYSITLICFDINNERLDYGVQKIKPSFTGTNVDDVSVNDNKDGSHTISFCPRQGGTLKFDVSINGKPAANCCLTKQVNWIISDAHGKGVITDGGLRMTGEGCECEYSWRVGQCYFESGVHTWEVQLEHSEDLDHLHVVEKSLPQTTTGFLFGVQDPTDCFEDNQPHLFAGKTYIPGFEVGIVDCKEIDSGMEYKVQRECVYLGSLRNGSSVRVMTLILDMDRGILSIAQNEQNPSILHKGSVFGSGYVASYSFTSRRVSPFFACWSPQTTLRLTRTY